MRPGSPSGVSTARPPRRRGRNLRTAVARAKASVRPALFPGRHGVLQLINDAQELGRLLGRLSVRDRRIVTALMLGILDVLQTQGEAAAQAALDEISDILNGREVHPGRIVT